MRNRLPTVALVVAVLVVTPRLARAGDEWPKRGAMIAATRADLTQAAIAIRSIEHCAALSPKWGPSFDSIAAKEFAVRDRIAGFLGPRVDPSTLAVMKAAPATAPICDDSFVESATARARAALDDVERATTEIEVQTGYGAWLGLFPLCKGTVRSVDVMVSPDTGEHAVRIQLLPVPAQAFAAYAHPFRVEGARMSFRIHGALVSRPSIYGHLKTALVLHLPSQEEVQAIVDQSREPCRP